jgi:hypothetical protein
MTDRAARSSCSPLLATPLRSCVYCLVGSATRGREIRSCGFLGSGRPLKYDGAPTTAMRVSGPIRTAIMSFATCSPLRTPASNHWATKSVSP